MNNIKLTFILLTLSLVLFSCKSDIKFEKSGWSQKDDPDGYLKRESMLNDLLENHKLKGMQYKNLIDLLGLPENYSDQEENILTYNIVTDYGYDIDPVYIKNLEIKLAKDSIVEGYKVVEIKH